MMPAGLLSSRFCNPLTQPATINGDHHSTSSKGSILGAAGLFEDSLHPLIPLFDGTLTEPLVQLQQAYRQTN